LGKKTGFSLLQDDGIVICTKIHIKTNKKMHQLL